MKIKVYVPVERCEEVIVEVPKEAMAYYNDMWGGISTDAITFDKSQNAWSNMIVNAFDTVEGANYSFLEYGYGDDEANWEVIKE